MKEKNERSLNEFKKIINKKRTFNCYLILDDCCSKKRNLLILGIY